MPGRMRGDCTENGQKQGLEPETWALSGLAVLGSRPGLVSGIGGARLLEALANSAQKNVTHGTIGIETLLARTLDNRRIHGRPILDFNRRGMRQIYGPVL